MASFCGIHAAGQQVRGGVQRAIVYFKELELFIVVFTSWRAAGGTCWGQE